MKSIKNLFPLFVIAAFFYGCVSTKLPQNYEVTPQVLETHGGKVSVTVKGTIPAKSFNKKAVAELTPVVKYNGKELALKPLTLKGEKATVNGTVINSKTGGSVSYTDIFDYKPEMNVSELVVKAKVSKGKKAAVEQAEIKIADGIIYTSTRVGHGEETQIAAHLYEKETIFQNVANLYFAYNRSDLNWNLDLNKVNKAKLEEVYTLLRKGWQIKSIDINAWASPEGEESLNQKLSEERAKTTQKMVVDALMKISKDKKEIFKTKKPLEEIKFNATAKGEDFDGFMTALQSSDVKDKSTISNVIKSQASKVEREQQIRNMTIIYAEIENMLSVLRRGEITISCFEPKKSDEQIAKLSTTYPDSLNVKELLYAATLTKDANIQLKIYKSATNIYPKDWRGFNNAAALNLQMGNIDEAANLLDKANALNPNNGQILNNLGVVMAGKKDFVAAKKFYESAAAQGINVTYNKGVLLILDGNYSGAINAFAGKTCDYNLALATLMNNNINEAKRILECAPKNGETYYLLAVIGARMNNVNMITQNLEKAISEVPAYKAQAKTDREFLKYFGNTDFQNTIK